MSDQHISVTLDRQSGYRFAVNYDRDDVRPIVVDETRPLGGGAGPDPTRMLATSVGHCLSASLLFCLGKARIPVRGMKTRAKAVVSRNDNGRLRVQRLAVRLRPEIDAKDEARMERCLNVFEDFCTVTGSIRQAIPVDIAVEPVILDPAGAEESATVGA